MQASLFSGSLNGRYSSQSNPGDIVNRWRSRTPSFSGVRRSSYSGKYANTGSSTLRISFRLIAMPTSSAVTLLVIDRTSC